MAGKNDKSYTLVMFTILLVLVLFEKSARNTAPGSPISPAKTEKQELKNYAPVAIPETSEQKAIADDELQIPEIPEPEEGFYAENITEEEHITLYFLKFYGKGNKSHSRLLKTVRQIPPGTKVGIETILDALIKGPAANEKAQGVLSAIPARLNYSRSYRVENGILHLSLSPDFEYGAGPDLMKDRIDQLAWSILELEEIKGIKLYIDGKKVNAIGGDGISVPTVLTKNSRAVMTF